MRQLLWATLILFVLSIGGVSSVVVAARTQPLPQNLDLLRLDQCAPPCWIGITPGEQMSLDEAEQQLRQAYPAPQYQVENVTLVEGLQSRFKVISQGEFQFGVEFTQGNSVQLENSIVSIAIFLPSDSHFTFAELHSKWGLPSYVWVDFNSSRIPGIGSVIYRNATGFVILSTVHRENGWQLKTHDIAMITFQKLPMQNFKPEAGYFAWQGFTAPQTYFRTTCSFIPICGPRRR